MGTYIYRVTARRVLCSDGKEANIAVYAYKPTFHGFEARKQNAKWHFHTGCTASDRMAESGRITDRFVIEYEGAVGAEVYGNPRNYGSFHDGSLGESAGDLPRINDVTFERRL